MNEEENNTTTNIDKLKAEREEYLNGWKRAQADLLNYQKDESRRLEEMVRFGNSEILREILVVIDNYDRGLSELEKRSVEVDEGLRIVKSQLEDLMRRRGVTKIDVQRGEQFNPMHHEAIAMEDAPTGINSGEIIEEVEPGYILHERVLRPARVKVAR